MNFGEQLTHWTIWLALALYALVVGGRFILVRSGVWVRVAWSAGCAFFLAHVICAFAFYHAWSHAAAAEHTAQRTEEVTGWRWSGGLYFNYIFAALWIGDVIYWWWDPKRARLPRAVDAAVHGFFAFMVFNAAVVFASGAPRWGGITLCVTLGALWLRQRFSAWRARYSRPCA